MKSKGRSVHWRETVLTCSRQGVSSAPPDSLLPFKAGWVQLCARPPDCPTPTDITAELIL